MKAMKVYGGSGGIAPLTQPWH